MKLTKLKPFCATLAFAALGLAMVPVTTHAFGLGDIVDTVTGQKTPSVRPGNPGSVKVRIVSSPYTHIFLSRTKLAPTGDVRSDRDFLKFGMTDAKGVFDQEIFGDTKCLVLLKPVNNGRSVVTKTIPYTGQRAINAKL